MALPKEIRTLFNDLPQARAERDALKKQRVIDRETEAKRLEEERKAQRAALRAESSPASLVRALTALAASTKRLTSPLGAPSATSR